MIEIRRKASEDFKHAHLRQNAGALLDQTKQRKKKRKEK